MATLTEIATTGPGRNVCKVCYAIANEPFGPDLVKALDSPASHAEIARADELARLPYKVAANGIRSHRQNECAGAR